MSALPYDKHGVRIDSSLARSQQGETIQVSTITAISLGSRYAMYWMPGVAAVIGGFGAVLGGQFLLGLALLVVAVVCFRLAGRRSTYEVNVTTSAGGGKTFAETRDAAVAQEIRSALEAAISGRG